MELAGIEFVEKQAERPAGAGFFLDAPALAEAGLAVFVDGDMGHDIEDIALPAALPGGHGALQPSALSSLR